MVFISDYGKLVEESIGSDRIYKDGEPETPQQQDTNEVSHISGSLGLIEYEMEVLIITALDRFSVANLNGSASFGREIRLGVAGGLLYG